MSVWAELVDQDAVVAVLAEAAAAARAVVERAGAPSSPGTRDTRETSLSPQGATASPSSWAMTHSWLLTGPPGSGRSVAALAFAAALQCAGEPIGCGQCPGCRTTLARSHADVRLVSTEAVQIKKEEVRDLVARAQLAPTQGRWRVIVVEDADRITEQSLNVLLKAIEEPPERTVWVLCAPSPEDMIPTIRSRCRHLGLRIPSATAVADLLVRRDGVDPDDALDAARAAQSHIGLARALAKDPQMRERRRHIITAPVRVRSVGEAVMAADRLLKVAQEQTAAQVDERNARERATLMRQLGADSEQGVTKHTRARLRELEEEQKRRAKRSVQDVLDRALVDLLAVYRDVLMEQLDTGQELVNTDMADVVQELAASSSPHQTIRRISAIETARRRLSANVAPLLALEAMAVSLRPQE
ncbi:DNA polymerase III subunit delta' [Schaalia sp. 19OD2882]|uniref:DNA polymerase III subunit delta' n=1 Tax=Schaalia sp. 19OD2882 TaxID=2794089 RepID=UPI001C1ED221|nr:DNA polymerase III subunit delta' [Schaalia sp. 19OD2882]QWW19779.1 DNA polymerase III subunit delta' [Schaalia sp. 19OD2882]